MATLFLAGMVLIGLFGYAVGLYLTIYKLAVKNPIARVITCLTTGSVVALGTLYLAVFIIWPGI